MQLLPIQPLKETFLQALQQDHVIVEAETGSGKSTRLPLWAAQQGRVLVIEPRRIACTSLAEFLAQQRDEAIGQHIGYAIKLENRYSEQSQVVFVTPGVALRWFAEDGLEQFDVIMVDEFHERRWDTDLLVALLKERQSHRLVVTSATLEGERLAAYLQAQRLQASGRIYDVSIEYRASDSRQLPDWRFLAERVKAEVTEAMSATEGDILVFLPGRKEIQQCQQMLSGIDSLLVVPLHASVSEHERSLALNPQRQQKVVLATNVAETSLTIPNIAWVIDSGLERRNEQRNGRTALVLKHISKASAKQRAGRAGRVMHGVAVRLYGQHAALDAVTPPQLQREDLTEPMLAAGSCGSPLQSLTFLETLPEKTLTQAAEMLKGIGALDDHLAITEHGRRIAPLPVDALYADLVARIEPKALKEAMIDLTAALAVPASLYSLSSNDELLEKLQQEEPLGCDAQLLIQLVRGQAFSAVTTDEEALREARGLSEQMRDIYELPELEVASRYQHAALAEAVGRLHPELLFVRRERRREALGNGRMEVLTGRNSRFPVRSEAALVLDQHSLPGKGVKQTLTLATVMMPVPLSLIETLELGQWQQGETVQQDGVLSTVLNLHYAGRVVASKTVQASGELALKPLVEAVKANECLPGFAERRHYEIEWWKLYVELGLDANAQQHGEITFESWFEQQLQALGVESPEDLAMFDADDIPFAGIPYWELSDFAEAYPFELSLGDLQLTVEYFVKRKLVQVVYKSGLRKTVPKRWELPRWSGYKVQFRKASRVIDIQ
ncbi:helicase-related protein [Vibrio fluvialis]|uniref:helicase-related protein n=1 Tax=Vibrio fluvialis TaxID=676 RepID=UPI001C9C487C|nr:helicase-related protein [Vibrio fluvialis]MBY7769783.1 DEAD/DEAH box helicase [Vibrio fluvialis]MBY8096396.1 DEAD/DEAH box helicase [Vibrio fluvialis]MCE7595977.1 DEAD/DEAH box helicase [Vibrio fluvialis]